MANGDSMQNVGIFDGDILIVDRSENTVQGDIIVANYNGAFICKILDKRSKQLLSASDKHKPVSITEADEFQIEGVVMWESKVVGGQFYLQVSYQKVYVIWLH